MTAKVTVEARLGHPRYASLMPSADLTTPLVAGALSAVKVAETSKDLQRFLLRFEEGGGVGADAAQRVRPLGAWGAHRMEPEGGRIEQDPLALDLFDHRALGKDLFERVAVGQPPRLEVE